MIGIYLIRNSINELVYVGSTMKSFDERFKQHLYMLKNKRHENPYLQNFYNKYGKDVLIFDILESYDKINQDKLIALENKYIISYNATDRNFGFNICPAGKSRIGTKWNEESKKLRTGEGNPMFGKGESRIGKLNPMFGKTLTDVHKSRMSKSLTGIKKPITSEKLSKPVLMMDKNMNIINEFNSAVDVSVYFLKNLLFQKLSI
jgi:group I intron endonuclease